MWLLDNIRIFKKDGVAFIDLPRTKNITYLDKPIVYETEMASGRLVQDIMGVRPTITAVFEYIPSETLKEVLELLRAGGFFNVTYPTPTGETREGMFKIVEGTGQKIFKFVNGKPMWYGLSLTFTSQEVIGNG